LKLQVTCLEGQIASGKTTGVKNSASMIIQSDKALLNELKEIDEVEPDWVLQVEAAITTAQDAQIAIGAMASTSMDDSSISKEKDDVMKLERLKLSTFGGDYQEWKSWHEAFVLNVHNNMKFNPQVKFSHLKKALSGEALHQVAHLTVTSENYDKALKILQDRYDNPQLTVAAYHRELEDLEPATDSFEDQYSKFDVINSILANIRELKSEKSEDDLRSKILQKFPEGLMVQAFLHH